jgi:MFS family permease
LYAGVYISFGLARSPWQIWILFALYGGFYGLTESMGAVLVVDVVDPDWRGRAVATYDAVGGLATLPASVVFGILYESLGPGVVFGFGATLAMLASLILPSIHPVKTRINCTEGTTEDLCGRRSNRRGQQ